MVQSILCIDYIMIFSKNKAFFLFILIIYFYNYDKL